MNERALGRLVVALTLGVAVGTLFFVWAELNWKNLRSPGAVAGVSLVGAALAALFGERMARRPTPIDWIHELVRSAMLATLVSGIGVLVSHLGDIEPTGGPAALFTNNEPNVVTPAFTTLMVVATVIATSSVLLIWRHRHASRTSPEHPLAETLAASGAWLSAFVLLLGVTGLVVGVELLRILVPHALLAFATAGGSFVVSRCSGSLRMRGGSSALALLATALGAVGVVVGLIRAPLPGRAEQRDANACRAQQYPGFFRNARATPVTAYRAPGVALRRVECTTTFQYDDEQRVVVVGRNAAGRDVLGRELFVRVVGTPLERARAACEILLADRCLAPLVFPSELAGFSGPIPQGDVLVPHERGGRLAFLAVTYEYPNGRRTTAGRRRIVVPHEVELRTGALLDAP